MIGKNRVWIWAGIACALALTIVVVLFSRRLVAAYYLFWGRDTIEAIFYEGLGFSQTLSSFLGVVFSFFYALAWIPLLGWIYRLLIWKYNARQFGSAFACFVFVYGLAPIAKLTLLSMGGVDPCFNQRTGEPLKWYITKADGTVILYDSGGFDPSTGLEKRPVTTQVCKIFEQQRNGVRAKQITGEVKTIQFFDPVSGEPRVWYHRSPLGKFDLFDREGFHPTTGELLVPVTRELAIDLTSKAEFQRSKSEIPTILRGCDKVPQNMARIVVIPTSVDAPTAKENSFRLRFTGAITDGAKKAMIAVVGHEMLLEGVGIGALRLSQEAWSIALAKPDTQSMVAAVSGVGLQAFNIEKKNPEDLLIGFWLDSNVPAKIDWRAHTFRVPTAGGKCNILNLVILPS